MTSGPGSRPATLRFEGERAKALEAIYLTPDVVAQREAVLAALDPRSGERVLDLGTGPGLLAAAVAERVGASGAVTGIDVSADMLAIAPGRRLARRRRRAGVPRGERDRLPFPDGAFDAAVCTQVYEYVEDMPLALREAARVLRAGGRLVVLDTDWDSIVWRSSDDARMARVLLAWDAHLVHRGLPRELPELLRDAGLGRGRRRGGAPAERGVRPADLQRRHARPDRRVRDRTTGSPPTTSPPGGTTSGPRRPLLLQPQPLPVHRRPSLTGVMRKWRLPMRQLAHRRDRGSGRRRRRRRCGG